MKRLAWIVGLFVVIIALILGIITYSFLYQSVVKDHPLVIEVQRGETGHHLAEQLAEKGHLSSPLLFRLLLKIRGQGKQLQAGEYQIQPGSTPNSVIDQLVAGRVMLHPLTIVNGSNGYRLIHKLKHNPNVNFDFHEPATPRSLAKQLNLPYPSIEGALLPNTYLFAKGALASDICLRAFHKMQRALSQQWDQRANNLPYKKPYQALIVASMIEKETALKREMPIIADVILKRWRHKRRLQIDAAVIYGLLPDHYQGDLTRSLLKKDTPYNTYRHAGLPPTPISMPSQQSLHAALHPNDTPYWYYVAKGDNSHHFSKTLQGQRQAIQRYQKQHIGS